MVVTVWDAATRKELLNHSIPDDSSRDDLLAQCDLSFSRDGKRLGITANVRGVRIQGQAVPIGMRNRQQAVEVDTGKVLLDRAHDGTIGSMFAPADGSPDGRFCIPRIFAKVQGGSSTVWNLDAGGKEVATLAGVQTAQFVSDGAQILGWEKAST